MLIKLTFRLPEIVIGILLAVAIFAMGMVFQSSRHQPTNNQAKPNPEKVVATQKPDPFSWDWLTHDGVVFFTGLLALIAVIQAGLFVWQLRYMRKATEDAGIASRAAERTADSLRITERAYVSGGAQRLVANPDEFRVMINNYGKTPAFIGTVLITIRTEVGLPEKPEFSRDGEFGGYILKPGTEAHVSEMAAFFNIKKPSVVYGRIYYRDVFNNCHSSGFILRIESFGLPAVEGRDAYWEDRPEPDLGPAAKL